MFITAGANIGKVLNPNDRMFFEGYILPQDRAELQISDIVQIAIAGLPQNEFGTINGKLLTISQDVMTTEK